MQCRFSRYTATLNSRLEGDDYGIARSTCHSGCGEAGPQFQHVSLLTGVWKEPEAWGIMLADLARHVANAYEQDAGLDPVETLDQIRAMMEAELSSPTDRPTGFIS